MKRFLALFFLFLCVTHLSAGLTEKKDSSFVFFPAERIYPNIFLDPLECQINGGSYLLFRKSENLSLYSTVNLGFNKPVFARKGESVSWEVNFGAGAFSQFDLIRKEDGTYLAGLMNTDFKLSGDFSIQKMNNLMRFRLFHISSHIGDDYSNRNNDTIMNDKSVNYEQADITYLRLFKAGYWYAGIGEIYTKYVFRERFSIQGGGLLNIGKSKPVTFFTSANIKLLAENDFIPDLRTALGISFNSKSQSVARIWLEYYSGQLPYSSIDYGKVNWIGLAMWINIF
jgi:hypothetical protein